jgi:hypothetical protein
MELRNILQAMMIHYTSEFYRLQSNLIQFELNHFSTKTNWKKIEPMESIEEKSELNQRAYFLEIFKMVQLPL